MAFSEIADAFAENAVFTEKDAWAFAKRRKEGGDDTLFNALGKDKCVSHLVAKYRRAWDPDTISDGALVRRPDFPLESFVGAGSAGAGVRRWVDGGWKTAVLIRHGPGGAACRADVRYRDCCTVPPTASPSWELKCQARQP